MKISNIGQKVIRGAVYAGLITAMLSCNKSYEGKIIAVELAGEPGNLSGARLVLLDPEKSDQAPEHLLTEFESSASPSLSHEGRYLYFQGRQEEGDPWQPRPGSLPVRTQKTAV